MGLILVDPSDGLSFKEAIWQFYAGGGKPISIQFSAVDPGWVYSDFTNFNPCDRLASVLSWPALQDSNSYFDVSQVIEMSRSLQLYQSEDKYWDSPGTAGPGQIVIEYNGSINATHTGTGLLDGRSVELYSYFINGVVSARDDLFDFDPSTVKSGVRGPDGELITMFVAGLQYRFGVGHDFWISFPGERRDYLEGNCCCVKNTVQNPKYSCKPSKK